MSTDNLLDIEMDEILNKLYTEIMAEKGLYELNSNFELDSSNYKWPNGYDFSTADLELEKHIRLLQAGPLIYKLVELLGTDDEPAFLPEILTEIKTRLTI